VSPKNFVKSVHGRQRTFVVSDRIFEKAYRIFQRVVGDLFVDENYIGRTYVTYVTRKRTNVRPKRPIAGGNRRRFESLVTRRTFGRRRIGERVWTSAETNWVSSDGCPRRRAIGSASRKTRVAYDVIVGRRRAFAGEVGQRLRRSERFSRGSLFRIFSCARRYRLDARNWTGTRDTRRRDHTETYGAYSTGTRNFSRRRNPLSVRNSATRCSPLNGRAKFGHTDPAVGFNWNGFPARNACRYPRDSPPPEAVAECRARYFFRTVYSAKHTSAATSVSLSALRSNFLRL